MDQRALKLVRIGIIGHVRMMWSEPMLTNGKSVRWQM